MNISAIKSSGRAAGASDLFSPFDNGSGRPERPVEGRAPRDEKPRRGVSYGEAAIRVEAVNKIFKLPYEKHSSLKSAFVNFYKRRRGYELQKALKNISFEVKPGEFFGIIGKNGSGKSTLLKLLAGIYAPSSGKVEVKGKLTPFIELGVGFNPELTGRENVYLNGALLGLNRKEMHSLYDDIVKFAELEKFMDQKLKNYSSGMQVRLAFSIAIRVKSDILLFDEVLAVGDAAFQQKCLEVFADLKKKGITILLVTHDMNSVLRFCDRVMLLDKGRIVKEGLPRIVADAYLELNYEVPPEDAEAPGSSPKKIPTVQAVTIQNSAGQEEHKFQPGDNLHLTISYKNPKNQPIHFGLQVFSDDGVYCFGTNTKISGLAGVSKKSGQISLDLNAQLIPGNYYINAATMNENATTVHDYKVKAGHFRISKVNNLEGIALLDHSWRL